MGSLSNVISTHGAQVFKSILVTVKQENSVPDIKVFRNKSEKKEKEINLCGQHKPVLNAF